jgi:signal peptidase II
MNLPRSLMTPKARWFWPLAATLLVADCATKRVAESQLSPAHVPHQVVGDVVRLTLAYNTDAAMGLSLGPYSRSGWRSFIDIGVGQARFWTFNVADVGITLGVLVLIIAFARRGGVEKGTALARGIGS